MKIEKKYITGPASKAPKMLTVKGIAIHWTANVSAGADALAHARLFDRLKDRSVHFFVDDRRVVQTLPLDIQSWHSGTKEGNAHYLSIEMCVNADGNWVATYRNAVELCRKLIREGKAPDKVVRHHDLSGKDCPKMLLPVTVSGKPFDWNWQLFLHHVKNGFVKIIKEVEVRKVQVEKPLSDYSALTLFFAFLRKLRKK